MTSPISTYTERTSPSAPVICPYLGTHEDPEAWFQFPSSANYCYRTKKPQVISSAYQHTTCLTPAHTNCIVYKEAWKGPLPTDISGVERSRIDPTILRGLGLAAIVIIIIGIIGVLFFHQGGISLASRPTQTQEIIEALPELPTATLFIGLVSVENTPTQMELPPTETPSPTAEPPTPTQTTSPTIPVPTEGPDMGTPFGPSLEFTLHTVQPSEALSAIARTYNTSVEVIRASNVLIEGASVWPGKVLVIIRGETDPTKTIKFCVMRLSVPITVEQLAQLQRISVDDIRFYNVLGPDETIPAHRWLIFPSENILDPKQCQ